MNIPTKLVMKFRGWEGGYLALESICHLSLFAFGDKVAEEREEKRYPFRDTAGLELVA